MFRSGWCGALAGMAVAVPAVLADTRPPVDIPALHDAQAEDAALREIDGMIRRGEWEAARDASSVLLERSKNVWHGALQRALVRLAFLEAKLGEDDEAGWHWQALQAMGGASLGAPFFAAFGAAGETLRTRVSRAPGEIPPGVERSGARPGLVPARRTGGEVPPGNGGCTASRGALWARVQAVVEADGRLTRPSISGPSVCFSFEVLKAMRRWTFEPARKDGAPVAEMYEEAIGAPARRPFGEIAASSPVVAEIASLLEKGDAAAAERRIDLAWSAALDAGSPSRPVTVTLMALRAIALAAHDDPEDQRRAVALWGAAQGDEPAFYDADLGRFGAAGARLDAHRWGEVRSMPMEEAGDRIRPPRVVRESRRLPHVRFPPSSYGARRVFIEAVIDEHGAVRDPLLFGREEGMRGLDLEALDAVCAWRFEPATLDGRAIPLLYVLSLDAGAAANAK